jgi:hypothetical protein
MYNEPDFYDLNDGSIGTILYRKNMIINMPETEKQAYVSRAANERMRMFINNITYGMNGNGPDTPYEAYVKARQDSWGELEDGNIGMETRDMQIQIGQKESYEAILKMETRPDFGGWINPTFVEMVKEQFKNK